MRPPTARTYGSRPDQECIRLAPSDSAKTSCRTDDRTTGASGVHCRRCARPMAPVLPRAGLARCAHWVLLRAYARPGPETVPSVPPFHLYQIIFHPEPMATCGTIAPVIATRPCNRRRAYQPCRYAVQDRAERLRCSARAQRSGSLRCDTRVPVPSDERGLDHRRRRRSHCPRRASSGCACGVTQSYPVAGDIINEDPSLDGADHQEAVAIRRTLAKTRPDAFLCSTSARA